MTRIILTVLVIVLTASTASARPTHYQVLRDRLDEVIFELSILREWDDATFDAAHAEVNKQVYLCTAGNDIDRCAERVVRTMLLQAQAEVLKTSVEIGATISCHYNRQRTIKCRKPVFRRGR